MSIIKYNLEIGVKRITIPCVGISIPMIGVRYLASVYFVAMIFLCITNETLAQGRYDGRMLELKRRFAERELAALAQPFIGVTSNGQPVSNLFTIRATGVSTAPIYEAAVQFLDSLRPNQKIHTQFAIDDPEWRRWSNVDNGIYTRQGISLLEMIDPQRDAAMNMMGASLSPKGLKLSRNIMKTDHTLQELNHDDLSYDEQLYYFTMMGLPSQSEPWGWQIDGHHLVINYFILGEQVVMSPVFLGGEPVVTTSGKYAGNIILQQEQDQGFALMQALGDSQRAAATLDSYKLRDNMQAAANKDNLVLDYAGIPVASFSEAQKIQFLDLIALFVSNMREGHAQVRMQEVKAHLDDTWFAWIGAVSEEAVFYYRIHSPVILIEFDHQRPVGTSHINKSRQPTRDHIHMVIRTPNGNDYGKDLLRQHLEQHPH